MQVRKEIVTLCMLSATALGCMFTFAVQGEGPTAATRASGAQRQRAAAGWLQLETDQRVSRERVTPLTPLESQQLQVIEQQERARYREQLQTQERELTILDRQERQSEHGTLAGPSQEAGRLQSRLMEQQRARSGLDLRRQMDRLIQGTPPGRLSSP
jgi:hypothetical protein